MHLTLNRYELYNAISLVNIGKLINIKMV